MTRMSLTLVLISTAFLTGCANTPTGSLYWKYDLGADFSEMKELMDSPEFKAQINDGTDYMIPTCGFADNQDTAEILEYLIEIGGDVTICYYWNDNFTTPLHEAVKGNAINNVSILLANGADPNFEDTAGETPLGIAEEEGYNEIAEMIKSYEDDWQKTKSINDINAFKEYLEQYPKALHSDEAKLKLALLESINESKAETNIAVTELNQKLEEPILEHITNNDTSSNIEEPEEAVSKNTANTPTVDVEEPKEAVSKNTVNNTTPTALEETKAEAEASEPISPTPSPKVDFACTFYSREQCTEYVLDDKGQIDDMKTLCFQSFGNVEASCKGGVPNCSYRTSKGMEIAYAYYSDNFYFKESCTDGGGKLR